jgi:hypothetical protein
MARGAWLAIAVLAACGRSDPAPIAAAPPAPAATPAPTAPTMIDAGTPPPDAAPGPVSPICAAAQKELLGPDADCAEERVADTPAGTLWRVRGRADPFAHQVHVIERADGSLVTKWTDAFLDVTPLLAAASPEAQARICAELGEAVVRCLPGDPFVLPRPLACAPPHVDGDGRVAAIIERFHIDGDQYQLSEPYEPRAEARRWRRGTCDVVPDGNSMYEDGGAIPPRTAWLAPPPSYLTHERAPAALERAICDAAEAQLGPHLRCEAWRFPDLMTSAGTLYFASTDAGRADALVRSRARGPLVAGPGEAIAKDLWPVAFADVRAGRLAPGALVELRFLAATWQLRVTDPVLVASDAHTITIDATFDDLGRPLAASPWGVDHFHKQIVIKDDGTWDWIPPRGTN